MERGIAPALVLVAGMVAGGCFPTPSVDLGPYGNGCPGASVGSHYCGVCGSTSQCTYCQDVNGKSTCPANPCGNKCDSSGGGGIAGTAGSGGTGGGGSGGASGGGGVVCNGTCPANCPADSMLECSQYSPIGNCSIQSCTCYGNTPTAYCGIFYRSSTGSVWWCGGGYNMACSAIGVQQCAMNVASSCQ
jgi:hypothetical protein